MLRRQTDRASREREVVRKQDFKQKQKQKRERERALGKKGKKGGEKGEEIKQNLF